MKKIFIFLFIISIFLSSGCGRVSQPYDIVATTLPVYDFTERLCEGTELQVGRLVTESVSCLHDYTLQVDQMRMIEGADTVILSGAGLEEFLDDALGNSQHLIDASIGVHMLTPDHCHDHDHGHEHQEHSHENDPHIWLSPENAGIMAANICNELSVLYPVHQDLFQNNLNSLLSQLDALQTHGETQLSDLQTRELITFHDGFAYFAQSFGLTILEAVEEESGSEASAAEIIHLVELVNEHKLPAIFTEISGSDACASVIHAETGTNIYTLDMAMSGDSYFDAMYHNIDTIKEAME